MGVKLHEDWEADGFDLPSLAPATGPFVTSSFLRTMWGHEEGKLAIVESEGALMALACLEGTARFVGDPELTDYHAPFGVNVTELVEATVATLGVDGYDLDSLPEEAVAPILAGFERAGWAATSEKHEVAAVLELPPDLDGYLASIGKKERHEMRRKRRRYERQMGAVAHETHRGGGWALDELVRLHRLSGGEKGEFLTEPMEALFSALAGLEGWRLDLLRVEEAAAAVVLGYSDATGYYLYNSAYDPAWRDASPGAVLLGSMIEQAIAEGIERFDFLKGDERYKLRLGARPRPLLRVEAGRP